MNRSNQLRAFDQAVAIVTGAASGIGKAIAEELARRKANVILVDVQDDVVESVARAIRDSGGKASAVSLDVTDYAAIERLMDRAWSEHGRVDYVFNNAGIGVGGEVQFMEPDDWRRIVAVNLLGVAYGVQAAYPRMIEQGFGHIINTASMAGLMPSPGLAAYSMTKHGVVGLSLSLRAEGFSHGVRVTALCPGVIQTAILEGGGKFGVMRGSATAGGVRQVLTEYRAMPPADLAREVLDGLRHDPPILIVPRRWSFVWWVNRLSPRLGLWLARRMMDKHQQAAASEIGEVPEAKITSGAR